MRKVLGLDLGTTSIGWALVNQAESPEEKSSIIRAGVRVNPLSSDEKTQFEQGKDATTNAGRRIKRSMRRNLQRYKLRRDTLIGILKREGWIDDKTILAEHANGSTFETYRLRSEALDREVDLSQFARILLMINKKRGYKSNRKIKNQEDGSLYDGMDLARELDETGKTPGEYCYHILKNGAKYVPEFYRSDLASEFDRIWEFQKQYYPEYLTDKAKDGIKDKTKSVTASFFKANYGILTADNKGKDKKIQSYEWRMKALQTKLPIEELVYVLADINGKISDASGLLGKISDRSKELAFNNETVGQFLWRQICSNPNVSLKNITFYRQDYLDEFEKLWASQSRFHGELTEDLKKEIRDVVIFYQRRLKSQKGLVSKCEFEKNHRVIPRSSPLFQEFKIWQNLNNIILTDVDTGEQRALSQDEKDRLAAELQFKPKLQSSTALKLLFGKKSKSLTANFKAVEGNTTIASFAKVLLDIAGIEDDREYEAEKLDAELILETVNGTLKNEKLTGLLSFDSSLDRDSSEGQVSWKLWHLLYSYEGDNSRTGNDSLISKISEICGLQRDYAAMLSNVSFESDYGSLSSRAIKRILPYLKEGNRYDEACVLAGYNHSHSKTKDELEARELEETLSPIPKNSLRNPVVEKILNQMINVINAISEEYGKPDEIHLEMARELKMDKESRKRKYESISANEKENEEIREKLIKEFGFSHVRKSDIVRYKLYEELKPRGYKTFYSNQYIPREKLFSKEIDIEHIIPQSVFFDDSFANKTLEYRAVNIEKANETAYDYVCSKYGKEEAEQYKSGIQDMVGKGQISRTKGRYLLMRGSEIPEDFLNRDLTNTQYIARKAKEMLESYVRAVVPTTGSITARLREDWQLVDVIKEIDFPKYEKAGLTFIDYDNDGRVVKRIKDWSKREDHRHHAMDALTIAFTKPAHIQYLNNMKAKSDKSSSIYAIWQKETVKTGDKRIFVPPMPLDELRAAFRKELESVLVSIKAKNKVATRNVNKTRSSQGDNRQLALTPRGELHKETVYGRSKKYETYEATVGGRLTREEILNVASKKEREALLQRLEANGGDPKKAFCGKNAPDKNPIWLDAVHSEQIGSKVKCVKLKDVFTIRKTVDPNLKVDKVLDAGIRNLLKERLQEYGGNAQKAFSNLDDNPIWLNKEAGIAVKRVVIEENVRPEPIRSKHDLSGREIKDTSGNSIPAGYVNLGNNHHIAIYRDSEGNLQEKVVSFFEAMDRVSNGLKPVDKGYRKTEGWQFLFSMKINEMFVFPNPQTGFDPSEIDLTDQKNYDRISPNLYRVQKLSSKYYCFRHHLETSIEDTKELQGITWKRITSLDNLKGAVKVRINHIGEIVAVGEYD